MTAPPPEHPPPRGRPTLMQMIMIAGGSRYIYNAPHTRMLISRATAHYTSKRCHAMPPRFGFSLQTISHMLTRAAARRHRRHISTRLYAANGPMSSIACQSQRRLAAPIYIRPSESGLTATTTNIFGPTLLNCLADIGALLYFILKWLIAFLHDGGS